MVKTPDTASGHEEDELPDPQGTGLPVQKLTQEHGARILSTMNNELQVWREAIDADLKKTVAEKKKVSDHKELPQLEQYPLQTLERELELLALGDDWSHETVKFSLPPANVPAAAGADLACNVARIAKSLSRPVPEIAQEIAQRLKQHPLVVEATATGPFVNVQIQQPVYAGKVLESVRELNDRYGKFNAGDGAVVAFDYSHPNIAKNMTVGHLRSTLIGHVLTKVYAAGGYVPVSINYLGDWGTQFGKLIYEYRKADEKNHEELAAQLESDPIGTLMGLYRAFVAREEEDLPAVDEARANFLKLEQGDPEITELWRKFREWSLQAFHKVYKRLDIKFDSFQGESSFAQAAIAVVEEGLSKGVLVRDGEGSVVFPQQTIGSIHGKNVEMKKDEIVLKPSGGTMYLSRDLAAIKYRVQELGAKRVVYVVGKEQEMHCAMLFAMAEKLGYIEPGQGRHVSFGHMTIDGAKMGTRKGQVQLMTDILDEAIERATQIMQERLEKTELSLEETETARKIAIGSLFFNDLKQGRERNIEFNPEKSVVVEAGQGPYLQYSYARINSILREVKPADEKEKPEIPSLASEESALIMHLSLYPEIVEGALKEESPHVIATYMDKLCKLVNSFYHQLPVLKAEEKERQFRIALMRACKQVMSNAGDLLHLPLPERM